MLGMGPWHLALLFMIVLVVFGPKSLPRVGQSLGRGIKEFKDAASGLHKDMEEDEVRRAEAILAERDRQRDAKVAAAIEQNPQPPTSNA